MQYRKWYSETLDKSEFGPGPWQGEPDKIQFSDEATGYPCLIVRNRVGCLCGYVGVPVGHPVYGQEYQKIDVDVHGGLSFSSKCQQPREGFLTREIIEREAICHVVEAGEDDNVWWLGFDCAHLGDLMPYRIDALHNFCPEETYKTVGYVQSECAELARQLKAMA